jgi:hypothetical protein
MGGLFVSEAAPLAVVCLFMSPEVPDAAIENNKMKLATKPSWPFTSLSRPVGLVSAKGSL